jgi:Cu/Ag efflux protein CusF
MQKIVGFAAASALALLAHGAFADEVSGKISNIDMTAATFVVDGTTFTADPENTVGTKLSDLKDGDTVRVEFASEDAESGKSPINAMVLEKE